MNRLLLLILFSIAFSGCASRSFLGDVFPYFKDSKVSPVLDLYNRNYVAAVPTAVGNVICGTPFFFLATGVVQVVGEEINPDRAETYGRAINGIYLVPAIMCGAVTGVAFIPFSFICEENPWDFDAHTYRNLNRDCKKNNSSRPPEPAVLLKSPS